MANLVPITEVDGTGIFSPFLACCAVGQVSTSCIHHFALLLLRNLNTTSSAFVYSTRGFHHVAAMLTLTSGWMHRFLRLVKPRP